MDAFQNFAQKRQRLPEGDETKEVDLERVLELTDAPQMIALTKEGLMTVWPRAQATCRSPALQRLKSDGLHRKVCDFEHLLRQRAHTARPRSVCRGRVRGRVRRAQRERKSLGRVLISFLVRPLRQVIPRFDVFC